MYIIGITGGTASGKTTFVNLLKERYEALPILFISQDDYYKDTSLLTMEEKLQINFDHPDALDFDLLIKHISALKNGISIDKPNYSFKTHNRTSKVDTITPQKILIVEGILILSNPKLRVLVNTAIFIDAPEPVRIERRIHRDIVERGRTRQSVLHQFQTNITPMHNQFIAPLKDKVDYIFDGTKDFNFDKINFLILKHL